MPRNVHSILWNHDRDANGEPLALVVYRNRTFEYFRHSDIVPTN